MVNSISIMPTNPKIKGAAVPLCMEKYKDGQNRLVYPSNIPSEKIYNVKGNL